MNEKIWKKMHLLVILDVLLEEQSVTLAAERMSLSVPSMSRLLSEIRREFDDPLLIRSGHKLTLTQRAKDIKIPLKKILNKTEELFTPTDIKDISKISREFVICANDIFFNTYASRIQNIILTQSPKSKLIFISEDITSLSFIKEQRKIDLYIGATDDHEDNTKTQLLFKRKFVAIANSKNTIFTEKITPQSFAKKAHMTVSRKALTTGPIDLKLSEQGLSRRIAMVAPSYSSALLMLADTNMILTAPEGIISKSTAASLGLRIFAIPLNLPSISIKQSWHLCDDNEAIHQWFRSTIKKLCDEI